MVSDSYDGPRFSEASNVAMHGKAARKPGRSWTVRGGSGNDFIRADDNVSVDRVDCGPGIDTVTGDPISQRPRDVYVNCEFRYPGR